MKKIPVLFLVLCFLLSCTQQHKEVKFELPSIIGPSMVLQRNTNINLWGKTAPGGKVDIITSWGIKKSVNADKSGKWLASLKTGQAGGPYEVAFQTKDTNVVIEDVLIGEVWLCSGQSNMEMPVAGWPPNDTINNSTREIASADYPMIRLFTVPKDISTQPLDNCEGSWKVCSPETVADFSATAYFFGKKIYNKLDVPVGLIFSSWGGTSAEAWTTKKYLQDFPHYKNEVDSFSYYKTEFDTLMKWMANLKSLLIENINKDFYESLYFSDDSLFSADYDDSNWPVMPVPALWESSVLPDFDGAVILRKTFTVPVSYANTECILNLGPIDDMDVTYVNGKEIGRTMKPGFWSMKRNYVLPAGTLKEGKNVVAVRVIDITGGGGIYSKNDITLTCPKAKSIILSGDWKYMPVAEIIGDKIYFYDEVNNYLSRPKVQLTVGPNTPTTLYNAMINPLVPYTLKGVIWYQGENNVGRGFEYRSLFPDLITSWREVWGEGDFPFYYVQIAPYQYDEKVPSPAAELREAQLMTMSLPNTGMVVTTDIGNPVNIHPSNKQEVGRRLALWALANDYGFDSLSYSGPLYDSITVDKGKIIVHFTHTDGGLVSDGKPLTYFEVAGADQQYYPAKAIIAGNTVEVSSEKVPKPVAVRFGWTATAEPNLFNGAGLPASPFRSDNWKRLSE